MSQQIHSNEKVLTQKTRLDDHFELAQAEYESMLRSFGIQPGWRVLDAGCGTGSYLPLMSQLVGATGHIIAMDLSAENIDLINTRLESGELEVVCPVETRVGSVIELPDGDNQFDALWCSAVVQYLTDQQLIATLAEFKRVVRSGGIVGVKDFAVPFWQFQPQDPALIWRTLDAALQAGISYPTQTVRNMALPMWMHNEGFANIKALTTLVGRFGPLQSTGRMFLSGAIQFLKGLAEEAKVSNQDIAVWQQLCDFESPNHLFANPNFHYFEGHILVVGEV